MDLKTLKDTPPWDWPPDAGTLFLGILRNPQADLADRLLAADLAGDSVAIDDPLAAILLSLAASPSEPDQLRARAAISLGPVLELADTEGFDEPGDVPITEKTFRAIQRSLRQTFLDAAVPKLVRRSILEATVRAPEDWQSAAVRTAWASPDPEWKLTAIFCMGYVPGFDREVLSALASPVPEIHYHAVCAAGNWELDAAWPHVSALAESPQTEKSLRLAAIEALATIRSLDSIEILADLVDDPDEDIADAASEALSMAEGFSEDDLDDDLDEDDEDDDSPAGGNRETIH